MTPSSATRLSTPLEPMMAVLTAPDRIRKPTTTTKALSNSLRPRRARCTFMARPPIRLSAYSLHAHVVGDEQHGQEADAAGQHQAVDEDDEGRLLEVRQLGRLDLAVDLGQRLLAAHGQDRMAEGDEDADHADQAEPVRRRLAGQLAQLVGPPSCASGTRVGSSDSPVFGLTLWVEVRRRR